MAEKTILLTLKVPASFKKKIDEKVAEGGFGTMANFIRTLLRQSFEGAEPSSKPSGNAICISSSEADISKRKFCMVSQEYAQMHGYRVEEMSGKPVEMIYPKGSKDKMRQHVEQIAKNGNQTFVTEHMKKDGTIFPVIIEVKMVMDEAGNRKFYMATASAVKSKECDCQKTN